MPYFAGSSRCQGLKPPQGLFRQTGPKSTLVPGPCDLSEDTIRVAHKASLGQILSNQTSEHPPARGSGLALDLMKHDARVPLAQTTRAPLSAVLLGQVY